MKQYLHIISFLLVIQLNSFGQSNQPAKIYYKHVQVCNVVGTTDEDFILSLTNDSMITITKYSSDFRDQHHTLTKQVFTGSYKKSQGTLVVSFKSKSSQTKNKTLKTREPFINPCASVQDEKFILYPPQLYFINDDQIVSNAGLFPALKVSSNIMVDLLAIQFDNWDKVMNEDLLVGN